MSMTTRQDRHQQMPSMYLYTQYFPTASRINIHPIKIQYFKIYQYMHPPSFTSLHFTARFDLHRTFHFSNHNNRRAILGLEAFLI